MKTSPSFASPSTSARRRRGAGRAPASDAAATLIPGSPRGFWVFGNDKLMAVALPKGLAPDERQVAMLSATLGAQHERWVDSPKLARAWGADEVLGAPDFIKFHEAVVASAVQPRGRFLLIL